MVRWEGFSYGRKNEERGRERERDRGIIHGVGFGLGHGLVFGFGSVSLWSSIQRLMCYTDDPGALKRSTVVVSGISTRNGMTECLIPGLLIKAYLLLLYMSIC